jgi:hypothetical protein
MPKDRGNSNRHGAKFISDPNREIRVEHRAGYQDFDPLLLLMHAEDNPVNVGLIPVQQVPHVPILGGRGTTVRLMFQT